MRTTETQRMNQIINSGVWFDKSEQFKYIMKHFENPKFKNLIKLPKSGIIIDIGCGRGRFLRKIKYNTNLLKIGADISTSAIKLAKKKDKESQYVICDAKNLPFKNNIFAAVYYSDSYTNLSNGYSSLLEAKRIAKVNSEICIYAHKDFIDPTFLPSLFLVPWRIIKYKILKKEKFAKFYWEYYFDLVKFSKEPGIELKEKKHFGVDYDWVIWNKFKDNKKINDILIKIGKIHQNKAYVSGSVFVRYKIIK